MTKTRLFILFLISIFILPVSALAFEVKKSEKVYVAEEEVIEGNLYVLGSSITVDGKVNGDIYCAGQNILINGEVAGDVICAGSFVEIKGKVLGSVRVLGQIINVENEINQNLMAFGSNIVLDKNASVGWEMFSLGALIEIKGNIKGDLHGRAQEMIVSGEVEKDVRMLTGNKRQKGLVIEDSAVIGGDLVYTDFFTGTISDKALIAGDIVYNLPKAKADHRQSVFDYIWGIIFSIFSGLAIGLVLISLWKKQIISITNKMVEKTGASIAWGALLMIATPILALLLILTLIGAKLAFILIGAWLILMCVGKIITSILVGRYLLKQFNKNKSNDLIWPLVVGISASQIIFSIPLFGWVFILVAVWWGLGGIFVYLKNNK